MLNMNFNQSIAIHNQADNWQASPANGVWRYPLEREQAESGHVTSLVRFDANSYFPEHLHPLGEEFWVLEGTFSDESGDYPAGSYVRNPPGSRHRSFTRDGCMIFVKLNQFSAQDNQWVKVLPESSQWQRSLQGYQCLPLHSFDGVHTCVLHFTQAGVLPVDGYKNGLEILVLAGSVTEGDKTYPRLSWLRFAPSNRPHLQLAPHTQLWVRSGHLADIS
ncbi:cupin domain-containing protein [Oceanisphaera pacifica]|uniref:Cupin domain-containing protein n=1 Tax=Oceanisphaera pacifica TaxID=2818389 RepID=A0ABS3NGB7_9GAMM|nr:cupin domain-containing protein [Oceanisphaera pacifica]MBO1519377.1 cupin domain-containing protein [Oceanisphaera pacifica]